MKVLIADNLSPSAAEIMKARGLEVDVKIGLKPAELKAIIAAYDGLAVRSATKVTPEIIAAAEKLRVVGRAGIGVDNIDVPAATARGIVVMNTPYGNAITTAEHAIAMLFALARQIPLADRSTQAGKWEKNRFMGVELTAKTLGVIGCGNIGSIVAERALGLRMRVIAYDPFLTPERAKALGVEKVELDELLRRADAITLHTPLTDQTRGIVNAQSIARMKRGVFLINCARGGLFVEDDVRAALDSGHVAGVAIDVFPKEPATDYVLFGRDNVVVTPHLGASTTEAQEKVALQIAEQIADYLATGAVVNAINSPSVSAEESGKLRPYMRLAQEIGSLAGQVTETGIKAVTIEYGGGAAALNTRPLTSCLLCGLLAPMLESVNMVNAPIIAHERNIAVSEIKSDRPTEYQTLIRLTVVTERQERSVAGTLFGGDKPRIVEINGIRMEAELGPRMLYIRNLDKPGLIGRLGTLLGNAGVNIATFHLGRREAGGDTIAMLEIDQPVDEALLTEVRALPHVLQAKALRF
ncbi:MAG: phosphoglycerate dehydrogenase [Alphaproteobacteria bacterium]|nr:phosphoglycerate dehydrogenase [Alphaproteobacteria bacterium]